MTEFNKVQLNTILSALDGQPRNPNTKDAALRAIGRHAERLRLSLDDLLAAAVGLLDGRMSPDEFAVQLRDEPADESVESQADEGGPEAGQTGGDSPAAAKTASEAKGDDDDEPSASIDTPHAVDDPVAAADVQPSSGGARAPSLEQQLLAACRAAENWLQSECDRFGETTPGETLRMLREAIACAQGQPGPPRLPGHPRRRRENTKESQVIAMLRRPEGATIADISKATAWQTHTVRGFFAAALKQRHGLRVTSEKTWDGERVYRIAAGCSSREGC